ncbi:MAG: SDR family oxidoreductase, partial [Candidatus Woesearchaeota archaeon]|nr:SDR family oxidoreductase [Candidatus Woesearchaeota archaeon]
MRVLDCLFYGEEPIRELYDNPDFELMKGSTLNVEHVVEAMKDVGAVVHLAELVGDPLCALDSEQTLKINYLATKVVADVCKYFQINRFIYMSSCSVYGASEEDKRLDENSQLNPVSLYAKMKIQSERAILGMVDDNFSPCIFRLATVHGLSPRMRFDLVVNIMTAKAVFEKEITVFGGNQWRPNVYVGDVGEAIIKALEAPIKEIKGEIINIGSDEQNYRIIDIGKMVNRIVPDAKLIV